MSTSAQQPVPLSPAKRLLGLLAFLVVIIVAMGVGLFLSGAFTSREQPPELQTKPALAMSVIFLVLAFLTIPIAIAFYAAVILTNCFTFDFSRPYLKASRSKAWLSNLVAGFLVQIGISFLIGVFLAIPLSRMLSETTAFAISFLGPLIFLQLLGAWFNIMAPVDPRMIRRRLLARGISDQQMATGRFIGTSDPSQSSMKKLTSIETDMGVLWINQDELLFRGDEQDWAIRHEQLIEIERAADAGSTSAYFGAVHVILRFRYQDGAESRIRLHPEGVWTATGRARALNEISARLNAWKANPSPGWKLPGESPRTAAPLPIPPLG